MTIVVRNLLILVATGFLTPGTTPAGDVHVAVATNFATTLEALRPAFEESTGHTLRITAGSSGKLYAQIVHGAPFDVFLSADRHRPTLLEQEGHAVEGSRFTYARGRLFLWSSDPRRVVDGPQALRGEYRFLALANPDLAPYGAAARETLGALDLTGELASRIVLGENVGQAYALVASGNAELGFVARSQLPESAAGWQVPERLHRPIAQDAVLLNRAAGDPAAAAFLQFLGSPEAGRLIEARGYGADRGPRSGEAPISNVSEAHRLSQSASPVASIM